MWFRSTLGLFVGLSVTATTVPSIAISLCSQTATFFSPPSSWGCQSRDCRHVATFRSLMERCRLCPVPVSVELEVVRIAAPCKLLDDVIGAGAKTALRHRAGSVCRLLTTGTISIGAQVEVL